jgi:NAD(P)-dependent dehydrogenase (short-subunit alcohol dehydrogenase family)
MSEDRRLALITGGGGAIGAGMAAALIRDGWRVALADISREAAEATAAKLDASRVADILVCDVCNEDSVRGVVADVMARHGRIDGLATAAGGGRAIGPRRLDWETTRQDWTLNLETHLISVMVTCQAVLPHMVAQRSGVIVNTSSGAGLRGGPPASRQKFAEVYAVAKAGVIAFTQSIALEFAAYGIRANCIAPGRAENNRRPEAELRELSKAEEAREPGSSRMSPLGRFGKAQDMGEATAYLMSERSSYVTGSVIDVSGGIRLH